MEIDVMSPRGERLPLAKIVVEANRHHKLSLDEHLAHAEPRFHVGALSVRFLGDVDTLQAWLTVRRQHQILEVPLAAPGELLATELTSFWDSRSHLPGTAKPVYYLFNSSEEDLTVQINEGGSGGPPLNSSARVPARAQIRLTPASASLGRGWIRFSAAGELGTLQVTGLLEGKSFLAALPVFAPSELSASRIHQVPSLPDAAHSGSLTLFNPSVQPQRVRVELLDLATGEKLGDGTQVLAPRAVGSFSLGSLLRNTVSPRSLRLGLVGEAPLAAYGSVTLDGGEVVDIALFPTTSAHAGGTYPVPALQAAVTKTTLVNLGDEPVTVLGHIAWEGGEMALPPLRIGPGRGHQLDFEQVALSGSPDLLGRRLDPTFTGGFFKWIAKEPHARLVARTEVQPRGGRDRFGFNCFGCCWSMPAGDVVPAAVELTLPGQSLPLDACVTYTTCSGTIGPYPTDPTSISSPSPFSWNGQSISASGPKEGTVSFQGTETEITVYCTDRSRIIGDQAGVDACKIHLRKSDGSGSWNFQSACVAQSNNVCQRCTECCNAQKTFRQCKGEEQEVRCREVMTCFQLCELDNPSCTTGGTCP